MIDVYQSWFKRLLDFILAFLLLIILLPVFPVVAILVRVQLGKPVIFKQVRAGKYGNPITIYKFRSMTNSKDSQGNLLSDERRITKLGAFLRATSLDEIPSLINVISGNMSLVGPRPLPLKYVEKYSDFEMRRLEVKPGITGLAQVSGRNSISWEEKFRLDIQYVDSITLILDLKVLARTIKRVLWRDGISADGHVTSPEFEGH